MKKKLLSIMLTTALVLTTVFAGAQSVFADTSTKLHAKALVSEEITAVDMNSDNTAEAFQISYDKTEPQYVTINMPKAGTIVVDLIGYTGGTVKIKSQPTSTSPAIGDPVYLSSSATEKTLYAPVSKAGKYYLEFSTYSSSQTAFSASYAPSSGTITKGKEFYGSGGATPSKSITYYKVTAPGTGYLNLSFTKSSSGYPSYRVKLANSSKKSIFKDFEYLSSSKNYETNIGVSKGTYYIAVKTSDAAFGMRVTYTSVKENSGTGKSSAKSIYKKGTKKGIITATQSSTSGDWYKFKITKSQKVSFQIDSLINGGGKYGGLKVVFYQYGRYTQTLTRTLYPTSPSLGISLVTSGKSTLAPGTYYIKVMKNNGGNGQYSIKWL